MSEDEKRRRALMAKFWEAASYNDHRTMNRIEAHIELMKERNPVVHRDENTMFWDASKAGNLDEMIRLDSALFSVRE